MGEIEIMVNQYHAQSLSTFVDYFVKNVSEKMKNDWYIKSVIGVNVTKEKTVIEVEGNYFNEIAEYSYWKVETDENYSETHKKVSYQTRDNVEVYAIIEKEITGGNE